MNVAEFHRLPVSVESSSFPTSPFPPRSLSLSSAEVETQIDMCGFLPLAIV